MMDFSPAMLIALAYNAAMGMISVPIVNWLKVVLGKLSWIPSDASGKISGWITPLVSSLIGLLFVYGGDWAFGLHVFANPNILTNLLLAMGLNGTIASSFFEFLKSKKV